MKAIKKQGFRIPVFYRICAGHYKRGYTDSMIPDERGLILVRTNRGRMEYWKVSDGLFQNYYRLN